MCIIIPFFNSGVDTETYEPVLIPYKLDHLKGGVNAYDLVDSLFNVMTAGYLNIKNSAFQEISKHLTELSEKIITECLPDYFKLGKVKYVDVENKIIHIEMDKNLPVGNCGDEVSVKYGMFCPDFRCSAHAADGTLKCLAQSETLCVDQVKSL